MSVRVMTKAWDADLPPMEKLVLLALADCANDEGICWPSATTLAKKSGQGERTVRRCIRSLIANGHLSETQRSGTSTLFVVHPCQSGTPARAAPLPDRPDTPARAAPKPLGTVNGSEAKASSPRRAAYPPPPGVPNEIWADYRKLRDRKKAPLSDTAYRRLLAKLQQLAEAGYPPGEVVALSVERGWTGFFEPKADRNERTDPTFAALADFNRIISGNVGLGAGIAENVEACRSDLDGPDGAARMDRFGG